MITKPKNTARRSLMNQLGVFHYALPLVFVAIVAVIGVGMKVASKADALSLCGNQGSPPAVKHVVVVMMENLSYKQVVGSTNAPYETSLASQCGNATANFGATHTSAANYLATSAGEYPSDSPPGCGSVKACSDSSSNLYNQLTNAGLSWRGYIEAMPTACDPTTSGGYKNGHNPIIFYSDIPSATCQANDIGVSNLTAQSGAFWTDMQNQTLPSFSWITPDEADDGEGSGTEAQNEQAADTWLQNFLSTVQQSNSYQSGNTVVLVTYDEGSGSDYKVGEDCTNESLDLPITNNTSAFQDSCHVPLFVVYPYTPTGDNDATFFDHYSITKTVEDIFGLPYLANAGAAQTASLIGHFGLSLGATTASPTVAIAQPANGSTVSGTVTISGSASDLVGVTQVQVLVDNGTPQTASGTTSWTSTYNTSLLSNGTHTITVKAYDAAGNVGTSSVTITINNLAATACPVTPAGFNQLSGNVSLEANQNGWTGSYNSNSSIARVQPSGGSYDGTWALQISPKAGASGAAGVNNANPLWVPGSLGVATLAGANYIGSAFVRASVTGEQIALLVRETTPSGAGVSYYTSTMTLSDTAWHQISSTYAAKNSGDLIHYSLYATNLANSSQYFQADCLSLQTPVGS